MTARWGAAGEAVPVRDALRRLVARAMYYLMCGKDAADVLDRLVVTHDVVLSGGIFEQAEETPERRDANAFQTALIEAAIGGRTGPPDGEPRDIVESVLRACADAPQMVFGNLTIMMLATIATTPFALAFCLHELAQNPAVQRRVHEELDAVLGDAGELDYDRSTELPYLAQVIKESMRKHPVTFSLRSAPAGLELGGHAIDEGTMVFLPAMPTHRNPRWWPEPERFDPDRFSEERVKEMHPCAFIPFGVGGMRCVGMEFAYAEMRLILARLLSRFSLEPASAEPMEYAALAGTWIHPKHAVLLRAERRKAAR
jgi:cytochrome P450